MILKIISLLITLNFIFGLYQLLLELLLFLLNLLNLQFFLGDNHTLLIYSLFQFLHEVYEVIINDKVRLLRFTWLIMSLLFKDLVKLRIIIFITLFIFLFNCFFMNDFLASLRSRVWRFGIFVLFKLFLLGSSSFLTSLAC